MNYDEVERQLVERIVKEHQAQREDHLPPARKREKLRRAASALVRHLRKMDEVQRVYQSAG